MNPEYVYYSKGRIYFSVSSIVYSIAYPSKLWLLQMFWKSNPIWVNSFGFVPRGICYEWKYFGLIPEPQAGGDAEIEVILKTPKTEWVFEVANTMYYFEYRLSKVINENINHLKQRIK